jgi:flavorubredoxin
MEIIPQVHLLSGSFANFYLIVEPDGLTLIDTGLSRHFKTTLQAISQLSRSPADLKWYETKARESVKIQAALDAAIVCPGHGSIVRETAGKLPR